MKSVDDIRSRICDLENEPEDDHINGQIESLQWVIENEED